MTLLTQWQHALLPVNNLIDNLWFLDKETSCHSKKHVKHVDKTYTPSLNIKYAYRHMAKQYRCELHSVSIMTPPSCLYTNKNLSSNESHKKELCLLSNSWINLLNKPMSKWISQPIKPILNLTISCTVAHYHKNIWIYNYIPVTEHPYICIDKDIHYMHTKTHRFSHKHTHKCCITT